MRLDKLTVEIAGRIEKCALDAGGGYFYDNDTAVFIARQFAQQPMGVGGPAVKYAAMTIIALIDAGLSFPMLIETLVTRSRAIDENVPPVRNTGVRSPASSEKYHPDLVHYITGY